MEGRSTIDHRGLTTSQPVWLVDVLYSIRPANMYLCPWPRVLKNSPETDVFSTLRPADIRFKLSLNWFGRDPWNPLYFTVVAEIDVHPPKYGKKKHDKNIINLQFSPIKSHNKLMAKSSLRSPKLWKNSFGNLTHIHMIHRGHSRHPASSNIIPFGVPCMEEPPSHHWS